MSMVFLRCFKGSVTFSPQLPEVISVSVLSGRPLSRRTFVSLAALAAGSAFTAGCQANSGSASDVYKIGLLLGLTGTYASLGESERVAIELYVEQLNADGGINDRQIELVVADTKSSESEAVNQLRKLATQDKVIAVVGPSSSGEGIAIKQTATSLKVPVVVLASSIDIVTPKDQAKYSFKEFPGSDASLRAQLEYTKELGKTKVALLAANNGYGQEPAKLLPDLIDEYGMDLVASEVFPPAATDVTAQLRSIAGKSPEVLLVWAVNPANAVVAKGAKAVNFPGLLFNSPGAATPQYPEVAGADANGTLVQGSKIAAPEALKESDPQYPVVQQLQQAWSKENDGAPNQYAANGWDGISLVVEAIKKANVDPAENQPARDALRDSLENNIKNFPLINAVYTFSPDQHGPSGIEGLAVLEVKDGKFGLIKAY